MACLQGDIDDRDGEVNKTFFGMSQLGFIAGNFCSKLLRAVNRLRRLIIGVACRNVPTKLSSLSVSKLPKTASDQST